MELKTIEEYKQRLEQAQQDITKLTQECNHFRSMLFTQELEVNGIFLAQKRVEISAQPLETIMAALEVHEKFAKLYAEILHTQMSKDQLKAHVAKREEKKLQAARDYREQKNKTLDQRVESKMMTAEQAKKVKAIKALAKTLGKSFDEAKMMIEMMSGGK